MSEELDRRSMIEAAMEQAEEGTLETPEEVKIEAVQDDISQEAAQEKSRNEKGQFTKQEEQQEREIANVEARASEAVSYTHLTLPTKRIV